MGERRPRNGASADVTKSTEVRPADTGAPVGTFGVLRIRPFFWLWLNAAVVFLGVMGQSIARSWLAFELTGTNAALGGVLLSFGIAMLIATPWGGVAADRLPKRLVLQIALALLFLTSAWIGIAVAAGFIEYWMLLAAGAIQAVGFALFNPARMAFLAELVPRPAVPGAVSLLLVNSEVSRVIGPAVAGLVIGTIAVGTEAVFLGCAVLFAAAMVVNLSLPPGRRGGEAPDRSPLGELVDGVRYVRRRPQLAALLLCGVGVTMAGLPYLAFLPSVANGIFHTGPAGYGILSASSAVGAVVCGLLVGHRSHRGRQHRVLVVAGFVFGVSLAAMAVAPTFWVTVAILVVVGGSLLAFQTSNQALLMSLSDMEFHGRIQGLVMLSFGAFGIAALPLGVLADVIGLRWTLAGMATLVVAVMAVFAVAGRRIFRQTRLLDLG